MNNLEHIIEEEAQRVKPMVYAKVNYPDAEDVMQDIRLAFFVSFPRFNGDSKLSTYAYSIAIKKVMDYFREKYKHRHAQMLAEVIRKRPGEVEGNAPPGWGFYTLSKSEKAILRLVGQGMSNNEIAETLYITTNTVRCHMKNLYRKLQYRNRVKLALFSYRLFMEKTNEN